MFYYSTIIGGSEKKNQISLNMDIQDCSTGASKCFVGKRDSVDVFTATCPSGYAAIGYAKILQSSNRTSLFNIVCQRYQFGFTKTTKRGPANKRRGVQCAKGEIITGVCATYGRNEKCKDSNGKSFNYVAYCSKLDDYIGLKEASTENAEMLGCCNGKGASANVFKPDKFNVLQCKKENAQVLTGFCHTYDGDHNDCDWFPNVGQIENWKGGLSSAAGSCADVYCKECEDL